MAPDIVVQAVILIIFKDKRHFLLEQLLSESLGGLFIDHLNKKVPTTFSQNGT